MLPQVNKKNPQYGCEGGGGAANTRIFHLKSYIETFSTDETNEGYQEQLLLKSPTLYGCFPGAIGINLLTIKFSEAELISLRNAHISYCLMVHYDTGIVRSCPAALYTHSETFCGVEIQFSAEVK